MANRITCIPPADFGIEHAVLYTSVVVFRQFVLNFLFDLC